MSIEFQLEISIHAPHAGRDLSPSDIIEPSFKFQSTRPTRGATQEAGGDLRSDPISIHAPHAGRDGSA